MHVHTKTNIEYSHPHTNALSHKHVLSQWINMITNTVAATCLCNCILTVLGKTARLFVQIWISVPYSGKRIFEFSICLVNLRNAHQNSVYTTCPNATYFFSLSFSLSLFLALVSLLVPFFRWLNFCTLSKLYGFDDEHLFTATTQNLEEKKRNIVILCVQYWNILVSIFQWARVMCMMWSHTHTHSSINSPTQIILALD